METNKIIGGLCATLLAFLGLNFFAEQIFDPHHGDDHHLAYALEVDDDHGGAAEEESVDLSALFAAADAGKGAKVYNKCKACHKVEDGANATGPHLWGIINRQIGAIDGFGYSGALPTDQAWTAENLMAFLEKPKKWAPGTSMGFAGIKKPQDRANLIAYLNEADGSPEPLE